MSEPVDVGAIHEFPRDGHRIVQVGKREIAIVRWEDQVFAVRTVCPHQAAPVCGAVLPAIKADGLQSLRSPKRGPVLQCTWHRWEFDLETGRALCDPSTRIKTFDARIEEGRVVVTV